MDIVLDPPRGITGVELGVPVAEALAAAAVYGEVSASGQPGSASNFKAVAEGTDIMVGLLFEDDVSLTAIEVWRPWDENADVRVLYDGIDVFRTPALQLIEFLEERGRNIVPDESEYYYSAPDLVLGFTRIAGHEVPLDTDDEPLYFEVILVAGLGYYDEFLDPTED